MQFPVKIWNTGSNYLFLLFDMDIARFDLCLSHSLLMCQDKNKNEDDTNFCLNQHFFEKVWPNWGWFEPALASSRPNPPPHHLSCQGPLVIRQTGVVTYSIQLFFISDPFFPFTILYLVHITQVFVRGGALKRWTQCEKGWVKRSKKGHWGTMNILVLKPIRY